jgi:hypothetical protein
MAANYVSYKSTEPFSFDKEAKTLVAEASSLQYVPGLIPMELIIKSHLTGVEKRFVLDKTGMYLDGEVTNWNYVEVEGGEFKLTIFNS